MGDNLNDVNSLERELQALREQRAEAKERLDNLRGGRGRGRGPGSMGGRGRGDLQQRPGVFSRLGNGVAGGRDGPHVAGGAGRASVFDRLYDRGGPNSSRPSDRQPAEQPPHRSNSLGSGRDRADADVRPNSSGRQPITSRLSSRVVVPESGSSGQHAADNNQGSERQQPALDEAAAAAAAPGGGLKRLRSAVVVNGETRTLGAVLDAAAEAAAVDAAGAEPAAKRPALQTDAKTKIRAKRMFGNLLQGTLLKAKDENDSFKSSKAAQRQEVERRAAQKAAAEDAKRREQEAQRREEEEAKQRQEREDQINRVMDLNLKSDIKVLEILYAKRIHRKQQLLVFCVTKSQPPIYWQPKQACEETDALLQEHAASFEEWKQQQLQQLEAEKGELVQRAAARRELAAARAAGAAARGEGQQQEEEQQEQEEGEAGGEDGEDAGAADGAGEAREEDMEDREAAEEAEEQQQEDAAADDEDQAADEQGGDQQQQAEEAAAARRSRRRQRGSDEEEEERLLSSEDEDD